ncbi:hypothetical protein KL86PLE_60354 [uncultured Pleomorphomonas sp.]|uniref:Uncharacterized protein n=1 Tax=uncultured Pleomorphomonas sp. TaxID=442121 RepID=A0A212LKG4_9HYPH|nr:hypothetical protein KL86PLE_60354 [uncultured Pleomorphomonas sp.]
MVRDYSAGADHHPLRLPLRLLIDGRRSDPARWRQPPRRGAPDAARRRRPHRRHEGVVGRSFGCGGAREGGAGGRQGQCRRGGADGRRRRPAEIVGSGGVRLDGAPQDHPPDRRLGGGRDAPQGSLRPALMTPGFPAAFTRRDRAPAPRRAA